MSGTGQMKGLRWNACTIHAWPQDVNMCLKFLEVLPTYRKPHLQYRGESLSVFQCLVFQELATPHDRHVVTPQVRKQLHGQQAGKDNCVEDFVMFFLQISVPTSEWHFR